MAIYEPVEIGKHSILEDFVVLGKPSTRPRTKKAKLIIGDFPIIRSGTIIYAGNVIGDNFQTGDNARIRENNRIGDKGRIEAAGSIMHSPDSKDRTGDDQIAEHHQRQPGCACGVGQGNHNTAPGREGSGTA